VSPESQIALVAHLFLASEGVGYAELPDRKSIWAQICEEGAERDKSASDYEGAGTEEIIVLPPRGDENPNGQLLLINCRSDTRILRVLARPDEQYRNHDFREVYDKRRTVWIDGEPSEYPVLDFNMPSAFSPSGRARPSRRPCLFEIRLIVRAPHGRERFDYLVNTCRSGTVLHVR
jgi:hypothetical protein